MVASDGSLVDVLLSATSERDAAGGIIRSLAVLIDVTEQRRAVRELAERDRTMQTLLANIPGMAYRCANDADWTSLLLSQGCRDLTGYDADELVGPERRPTAACSSLPIGSSSGNRSSAALAQAQSRGRSRIRSPPATACASGCGSAAWVSTMTPGRWQQLEGFISDITELHRAEDALREREQMISGLVESLPGTAYRSDLYAPWHVSFLSEGFRTLLGHDPTEFTDGDRTWADFVHPDDLERIEGELDRDLDAGSAGTESEYRMITADGETRWVLDRAVFVPGEDGRPAEMIGLLIDVSGLHEALDAQAESERRLRTTIGNIPGMVYRSQAVAPWSDELIAGGDVSVTGYSVAELTDPDFRWVDIMEPEDVPLLDEATRAAGDAGRGAAEYRIRTKDGDERWLLDRFTLVRDDHGDPVAQEGILLDVTEQHQTEHEILAYRRELELHAAIATIFLTAPPDRMFTAILGMVREAVGARWGFFGYLDRDGSLVAPSLDAEIWDACRVEGKPQRFPEATWSDNTWSRAIRTGQTQVLSGQGVVPEGHLPVSRAVATPIVHGEETIGVFILAERETDFSDEDVRLLESIAASTAPVLHEWRERHHHEAARVEAERALRESEHRYRALYDGSPVGVFVVDRDLIFLDCNPAFEEILGAPVDHYRASPSRRSRRTVSSSRRCSRPSRATRASYEGPYTASTGRTTVADPQGGAATRRRRADHRGDRRHRRPHQPEGERGQDPPPAAARPCDRPREPGAPGGPHRPGGQARRPQTAGLLGRDHAHRSLRDRRLVPRVRGRRPAPRGARPA